MVEICILMCNMQLNNINVHGKGVRIYILCILAKNDRYVGYVLWVSKYIICMVVLNNAERS